jgi:DNA polymerase-4
MERIIFHIDVNNAFLSWSAVDMLKKGSKLDIRTIPSVVGGDETKRRGVVVARSYPAKKAGISSGEPLYQARKKVDKLYVVQGNKEVFTYYSNEFYKILCKYSPTVERYSIDECFMDMTGTEKLHGDLVELAYKIKEEVKEKLGFTVNVGIGNNKLCAKMASDFEKPDKVHTLFKEEIKEKMWPLQVDDLFMVGKSSSKKLHELGINTIYDLAHFNVQILIRHFKSMGKMFYEYANGIDESSVERSIPKNQGIGHSVTLPEDLNTIVDIKKVLHKLSSMVGLRLRNEKKYAKVVSVQLRNNDFFNYQHQKKLVNPISSNEDIYEVSCELLKIMWKEDPIRLVGLRVSDFTDEPYEQISLFDEVGKIEKRDKIQKTIDDINKKFGNNVIKSAALINDEDL